MQGPLGPTLAYITERAVSGLTDSLVDPKESVVLQGERRSHCLSLSELVGLLLCSRQLAPRYPFGGDQLARETGKLSTSIPRRSRIANTGKTDPWRRE